MNQNQILPTGGSFLAAEDCNLACEYCFINTAGTFCTNKRMSKEVAKKGLDYLCRNANIMKVDSFSVMLFGGEPMLNPDVIEFIFKYGLELANKHGKRFDASIITNGTIMNDRLKDIFMKYKHQVNLSCQISIDGKKESQDLYRVNKNGMGSFDMIEKNLPIFKEIFEDRYGSLSVHGCINKKTMPKLYENYKFLHDDWGFTKIWFMPIHDEAWDEDDVREYEKQLGLIYDNIINAIDVEKSIAEIDNYAPLDRCFKTEFPSHPCSAGRTFISINVDGDIYPCHQFYFNDLQHTTKLGNVNDGIDDMKRKVFLDYSQKDLCTSCDCINCYRCIAENFYINGSMVSQIKGVRCELSKLERDFQKRLKKELAAMGLFDEKNNSYAKGNNPNNPDCLCDSSISTGKCEESSCKCDQPEVESDEKEALKLLLQKVDCIESMMDVILKKLL